MHHYLQLIRIHTLPLVFASLSIGILLALKDGVFSWSLSILILLTATNLQIVANIANDYGDGIKKIDGKDRIGFERMWQSGKISKRAIKIALLVNIFLAAICGATLLVLAFGGIESQYFWVWIFIGIVCIVSALRYSLGKKPHSSTGLGDISVFIFFGPVAVIGSYFLLTKSYHYVLLLESTTMGLLTVSVLNLNNIRDIATDQKKGRQTFAIRLGEQRAKIYQKILVLTSLVICLIAGYYRFEHWYQWIVLLVFLPLVHLAFSLGKIDKKYNQHLKKQCMFIFLFSVSYGTILNF